jgi:hypothetical protein
MPSQVSQKLSFDLLRFDAEAYPRRGVGRSRVAMFEDVIQSGGPAAVPPIEVIHDGAGGYTIVEGVHRSIALRNLGYEAVDTVTLDLPGGLHLSHSIGRNETLRSLGSFGTDL